MVTIASPTIESVISPHGLAMLQANYEGGFMVRPMFCRASAIAMLAVLSTLSGWYVAAAQDVKLPDDKILVPGVLDTSTNYVEHPELVAERLCRFADIVGRERVMAGSDCGFGTFAGYGKLDPDISFKKLRAMVEGAAIASNRLW